MIAITVPTTDEGGEVTLAFAGQADVSQARREVGAALDRGAGTVSLQGHTVAVSAQLLAALARDPVAPPTPTERGTHGGRKFLLIHTNEEVAWSPPPPTAPPGAPPRLAAPFQQPRSLVRPLKAHQEAGLRWLRLCDQLSPIRRGVLLADDMGLGKTVQVLTHLAWLIEEGRLRALPGSDPTCPPWRPILIVAPLILLENETWQAEMAAFFASDGDLFGPVLALHGNNINRVKATLPAGSSGPETVIGRPTLDAARLMEYRTVITNYETVVNYQHSLAQLKDGRPLWSVIVTDEAQKYKAPNTKVSRALKALDAGFLIACTGTPVENRLLDLWNIVDMLQPTHLGTAQEFSKTYERGLDPETAPATLERLREELYYGKPHALLLRRTKRDLLQDDLPEKTVIRVRCELSSSELATHLEILHALHGERLAGRHLAVLHRLGQLYQHPALLRDCDRLPVPEQLLTESDKLRAVMSTLRGIRQKGEKAIVFARLIAVQQMLASVIEHEFGTRAPIINGGTSGAQGFSSSTASTGRARMHRKLILDEFRAREGFGVLILSPFVAGIGLTITEANHVIHYGRWWNPAVESQATDRAHRIGQTRPVFVYLPILVDPSETLARTFDERLDAILEGKTSLARDFLQPTHDEGECAEELCEGLEEDLGDGRRGSPFSGADLERLAPRDFEAAVGALYRAKGYETVLTSDVGDGGADVIAVKHGKAEVVQAKHSAKGHPVDVEAVSDLIGAMDIYREELGCPSVLLTLVTNSTITPAAQREARARGIRFVSGSELASQMATHEVGMGMTIAAAASRERSFRTGILAARVLLAVEAG